MKKEKKKETIWYAYRDTLALYDEGMEIEQIQEVLEMYEEEELYLHCEGIKQALNDIKTMIK